MASDVIDMQENRDGVYVQRRDGSGLWVLGGLAAVGALAAGAYFWKRRTTGAEVQELPGTEPLGAGDSSDGVEPTPTPTPTPAPAPKPAPVPLSGTVTTGGVTWANVRPLPKAADVPSFDLTTNWGKTPGDLRPLFALMEVISGIEGAGRIFAIIAKREAGFVASAHNSSKHETDASRRAYKNAKGRNLPLTYGVEAGEFGSGGLFGALAPYFLWTGVQEAKKNAPLLGSRPEIMFLPRVAAFGACVYMQRVLDNYRIDDHADIKVGWASPSLLKGGRGGSTYQSVRTRFFSDAGKLGIELEDRSTIPADLSAKKWPGVLSVFQQLVGELPEPVRG